MNKGEAILYFLQAIIFVLALMAVTASLMVVLQGCSSKQDSIAYVPTPMKCDYNLTKFPEIKTNTMQEILNTTTAIIYDDLNIRESLYSVPCLNIRELK